MPIQPCGHSGQLLSWRVCANRSGSLAKLAAMRPSGSVEPAFNRRIALESALYVCWRICHGTPCKATDAA
jgi:hypothetical protein